MLKYVLLNYFQVLFNKLLFLTLYLDYSINYYQTIKIPPFKWLNVKY